MEILRTNDRRQFILYCSIAGFISAWAISGLLVIVDIISDTPPGTFFAVIGVSLGISDPVTAQYIGFILHVITGMVCWKRIWTNFGFLVKDGTLQFKGRHC